MRSVSRQLRPEIVRDAGHMLLKGCRGRTVYVPANQHVYCLRDLPKKRDGSILLLQRIIISCFPVEVSDCETDGSNADAVGEAVVGLDVVVQLGHCLLSESGAVVRLVDV